jgi:hypothetical protein
LFSLTNLHLHAKINFLKETGKKRGKTLFGIPGDIRKQNLQNKSEALQLEPAYSRLRAEIVDPVQLGQSGVTEKNKRYYSLQTTKMTAFDVQCHTAILSTKLL